MEQLKQQGSLIFELKYDVRQCTFISNRIVELEAPQDEQDLREQRRAQHAELI